MFFNAHRQKVAQVMFHDSMEFDFLPVQTLQIPVRVYGDLPLRLPSAVSPPQPRKVRSWSGSLQPTVYI